MYSHFFLCALAAFPYCGLLLRAPFLTVLRTYDINHMFSTRAVPSARHHRCALRSGDIRIQLEPRYPTR